MNLTSFHFIRPLWLLCFIPCIVLLLLILRRKQSQGSWEKVCDSALLPFVLQHQPSKQRRIPLFSSILACTLLILALAGPSWERMPAPVFRNDSALVIALNLSTSMNAADISPSRLTRARYKISDILKQRKDGQTALLVYADDAFTVTPLTNDNETIDSQLTALNTDIMPSQGSNAEEALQKAKDLLTQAGLPKGQILLITDHVDTDAVLPVVKDLENYTISVLAVGTAAGGPIKAKGGDFVKDAAGNIIIPKLDASALENVANAGHGVFMTLRDDNQDVERIMAQFDRAAQEANSDNNMLLEQWLDQGPWLILAAVPFAALAFRKGILSLALIFFLPWPNTSHAFAWQDLWLTKDQQAQRAFSQGEYSKAATQFADPAWQSAAQYKAGDFAKAAATLKDVQDADGFYNQGNALAQSGKLADAIKAYQQALQLKPNDADTLYNKDLVEKELKKQQKEQQKDKSNQQQKNDKSEADQKEQKGQDQAKDQQQQQADQKQEQNPANKAKEEQSKQQQAQQDKQETQQKPEQQKQPAAKAEAQEPKNEKQQANEQWLKRIPDDPAGLLRRKFKYQYNQRNRQSPLDPDN